MNIICLPLKIFSQTELDYSVYEKLIRVVIPCNRGRYLLCLTLFGMTYVIYDIGFNKGIFLKKTLSRRNLN
jgi:hypothetical protein